MNDLPPLLDALGRVIAEAPLSDIPEILAGLARLQAEASLRLRMQGHDSPKGLPMVTR